MIRANNKGFTIVELMIVVVISLIVVGVVYTVYQSQNRSYLYQEKMTAIQQNLRAATYIMSDEIRMVGTQIATAGDGTAGNPFQFRCLSDSDNQDNDNDGTVDENGEIKEVRYRVFDDQGDGDMELGRLEVGSGNPEGAIAENIQAIGFAYAYDGDDNDSEADVYYPVDTNGDGSRDADDDAYIIWAVQGAGGRWYILDSNNDGQIDDNDSANPGVRANGNLPGDDTGVTVDLNKIRAVKIWTLAVSDPLDVDNASRYYNNQIYIVGDQKVFGGDSLIRKVQTTSIKFRNFGP